MWATALSPPGWPRAGRVTGDWSPSREGGPANRLLTQCLPFTGKVVVITTRLIPVAGGMVMDQNGMVKVWLIPGRLMCSLITGARLLGRSESLRNRSKPLRNRSKSLK